MSEPSPGPDAGPQGGSRLRRALRHPSRGQLPVAVLLCVLAFAAVTQVRSTSGHDSYAGLREADLVQVLNGLQANTRRSQAEIDRLSRTREQLQSATQRRGAATAQARRELATLRILAGTAPAQGPGISVRVTVPGARYRANDLLDGIEELRDAGAEAIAINGQVRVVAQSYFADGDGGLVVDGRRLTPPYRIDAIGAPQTLSTALNITGGFRDDVRLAGGRTEVTRHDRLVVGVVRPAPNG